MKLLAVETAVTPGSVALLEGRPGEPPKLAAIDLPAGSRTAQSLAPAMAELLDGWNWSAADLDVVAASIGPGSFTGLRIGVTAAKTLAYAAGARCVAVGTLAAIAHQAQQSQPAGRNADGWAVLDAQRGDVFAARLATPTETTLISQQAWLRSLQPGDIVAGPVLEKLAAELPDPAHAAPAETWRPRAETVALLALGAAERVSPFELLPLYGRLSAAEEKLAARS